MPSGRPRRRIEAQSRSENQQQNDGSIAVVNVGSKDACLRMSRPSVRLAHDGARTDVTNIQSQMALTAAGIGACLLSAETAPLPPDLVLKSSMPELGRHQLSLFWLEDNENQHLKRFKRCLLELT